MYEAYSEMIWNERPAQSRRAASKVLNPMSLMIVPGGDEERQIYRTAEKRKTSSEENLPEKLLRIPLGTEEPNIATVKHQALGSARAAHI